MSKSIQSEFNNKSFPVKYNQREIIIRKKLIKLKRVLKKLLLMIMKLIRLRSFVHRRLILRKNRKWKIY